VAEDGIGCCYGILDKGLHFKGNPPSSLYKKKKKLLLTLPFCQRSFDGAQVQDQRDGVCQRGGGLARPTGQDMRDRHRPPRQQGQALNPPTSVFLKAKLCKKNHKEKGAHSSFFPDGCAQNQKERKNESDESKNERGVFE
jgi:hypothetical protein